MKWFNGFELSRSSIPYDFACPLIALFSSFILGVVIGGEGGFRVGFGGLYPSLNFSGG